MPLLPQGRTFSEVILMSDGGDVFFFFFNGGYVVFLSLICFHC